MPDDKNLPTDELPTKSLTTDSLPKGTRYSNEAFTPEYQKLDPDVEKSAAFKKAKGYYDKSFHEVKWGPDLYRYYSEFTNPFFYRVPKEMKTPPSHLPQNPINLELHLRDERQRLEKGPMSTSEREWRKKYLASKLLHPDEPMFIEQAQLQLNPLRRLYRWPWDTFARKVLYPYFGFVKGHRIRQRVPKYMMLYIGICALFYHYKYNEADWIDWEKVRVIPRLPDLAKRDELEALHPELIEKAFPTFNEPKDFTDYGFSKRKIFLNLGESSRPW